MGQSWQWEEPLSGFGFQIGNSHSTSSPMEPWSEGGSGNISDRSVYSSIRRSATLMGSALLCKNSSNYRLLISPISPGSKEIIEASSWASTGTNSFFVSSIFLIKLNLDLHSGHWLTFLDHLSMQG